MSNLLLNINSAKTDEWVWGSERIIWGFHPDHKYTLKVLEPKKGRAGCLSLQYHNIKSESWIVHRGKVWGLCVVGNEITTRVLNEGDVQNLSTGMIHRLMGVSEDAQVIEASTPDAHAADKSVSKDVVRLHCVLGREVVSPRNELEKRIVEYCITVTEEAILAIEKGNTIPERVESIR